MEHRKNIFKNTYDNCHFWNTNDKPSPVIYICSVFPMSSLKQKYMPFKKEVQWSQRNFSSLR